MLWKGYIVSMLCADKLFEVVKSMPLNDLNARESESSERCIITVHNEILQVKVCPCSIDLIEQPLKK